jgi:hypothetical protein
MPNALRRSESRTRRGQSQGARGSCLCTHCLRTGLLSLSSAALRAYWCTHCGARSECIASVLCPNAACGRTFEFAGQSKCPACAAAFADGIPLQPVLPRARLIDLIFPRRRRFFQEHRRAIETEFQALHQAWAAESAGRETLTAPSGTRLVGNQQTLLDRHHELLRARQEDIEKFLVIAPTRLAKFETHYSWEYDAERDREVDRLLSGILAGKGAEQSSIGFLARCHDSFADAYSRPFLKAELERRFNEARSRPCPAFQLSLDYARHLTGPEFEEWVARLLREQGLPNVHQTQVSRDQGADLIVCHGDQKVVLQLKQYSEPVGNGAVQEAHAAKGYYQATDAWVVTTSVFTKAAVDLAYKLGVELVPGSQLLELPRLLLQNGLPPDHPVQTPVTSETRQSPPTTLSAAAELPNVGVFRPVPAGGGPFSLAYRFRWMLPILIACIVAVAAFAYSLQQKVEQAGNLRAMQALLDTYQSAIRSKNLAQLGQCYAPVLETYYGSHDVPKEAALREISRAFATYQSVVKLSFRNITWREADNKRAIATLDKEWDFRGPKEFAGDERQELVLVKNGDQWRIASEKELRVYWVQHSR